MGIKETQRVSEPSFVVRLWKTIKDLKNKKLKVTKQQLITHMTLKYRCLPDDTRKQINKALYDELLVIDKRNDCLSIPTKFSQPIWVDKDMFCFTCHSAGEVVSCKTCWRVMHGKVNCWEGDYKTRICKECQAANDDSERRIRGRIATEDEMRGILMEVMKAIQSKCPEIGEMFSTCSEEDRTMWHNVLMKPELTIQEISYRIQSKHYKRFLEFYQDFRLLIHNIHLIFGPRSLLGSKVTTAHSVVMQQENDIRLCIDCYLNWSKRNEISEWFSIPCEQPHPVKLVKIENGSFIPGKVLLEEEEFTSVKLFGSDNKMRIVGNHDIRPITQEFSPRRPNEITAFRQFKKYVENLEARGIPTPLLRYTTNAPNVFEDFRRKGGQGGPKKPPGYLLLKNGVKVHPKMGKYSDNSESEEEEKFSPKRQKEDHEWVRRSSRRRQPVKRYVDEIIAENREVTKDQMKRIKQEIVGEDSSENIQEIRRPPINRIKIERTKEGLVSRIRQDFHPPPRHVAHPSVSPPKNPAKNLEAARDSYQSHIDDLKIQLRDKVREVEGLKKKLIEKEDEVADAKRKQYCKVCLERAYMYCCFDHSYCSQNCQLLDWKDKHKDICKNEALVKQRQASSAKTQKIS